MSREYHSNRDGVPRSGETVDGLLNKIEDLADATQQTSGMMSKYDKKKLDEQVADTPLSILEIDEICNF